MSESSDFTKYSVVFDDLVQTLPEFESRFALSLDDTTKYTTFSSILERYLSQLETSDDGALKTKSKRSFIRAVVEELTTLLHKIYVDVFTEISLEKAKKMAKESVIRDPHRQESKLTYGEIDFYSFVNILERLNPQPGDSFVDLGHGTGRAMVCTALLYGHVLGKIQGVEIIPELNAASEKVMMDVTAVFRQNDHIFASHKAPLMVSEGDFTTQDFFDWTTVGNGVYW